MSQNQITLFANMEKGVIKNNLQTILNRIDEATKLAESLNQVVLQNYFAIQIFE